MAIGIQAKAQAMVQKALANKQKQEAASTAATQSGSTSTPTTTSTPKVTPTPKAVQSQPSVQPTTPTVTQPTTTPDLTKLNLFNIKGQVQQAQQTAQTSAASITKDEKEPDNPGVVQSLVRMYDGLPDSMKQTVGNAIEENGNKILSKLYQAAAKENKFTESAVNLFSNIGIGGSRWTIDQAQGALTKAYKSNLIPTVGNKRYNINPITAPINVLTNLINKSLNNSEVGKNIKEKRNNVIESVFNKTEQLDQWLADVPLYKESKKEQKTWAEQGKGIADAIDEGRWDIVATNVGETIGQMLPSFIATLITKDPKIMVGTTFSTVFLGSYKNNLVEINNDEQYAHLTDEQKDELATLQALAEAGIESLGDAIELAPFMEGKSLSLGHMLGIKNAVARALVEWQGSAIIEGGEEVITQILQDAFSRMYGGKDKTSLKELGEIFGDTFLIMQFVGAAGGYKGGIETHRRNTAEKLLAHEAENFDDFEEFLETAHRGGVEDDELIVDAWATSKGLTNEQRATLKKTTSDIKKQETKARELYEEKQNVESQLTQLRLTPTENEIQIKQLETRLQEIDNNINEIDTKINEYMNLYGPTEELPAQQQIIPQQQGGENLSQQTMRTVGESTKYKLDSQTQYELSNLTSIREGYGKKSINKNNISKLLKELSNMAKENAVAELAKYNKASLQKIAQEVYDISYGKPGVITQQQSYDIIDYINSIKQYVNDAVEQIKQLRNKLTDEELKDIKTPEELRTATGRGLTSFVIRDSNYSKHLLGLKNVNIKNLKGDITDETARKFGQYVAKFSQILGIDFNKVLNNVILNVTQNDNKTAMGGEEKSSGFLGKYRTKEQLEDLVDRLGDEAKIQQYEWDEALEGIVKAGIYVAKKDISEADAVATLAHEFFHLLDLKYSIDQGFPVIQREFQGDIIKDWISMIDMDNSWKTFKTVGITSPNDVEYYNDYTEILSRYAEQYVLYKMWKDMGDTDAKEMFENYTRYVKGYWTEEAFKDLIPKFEDLLENRLEDYRLDIGNQSYYDVMMKMDEYKNTSKLDDDKSWMMDIARRLKGVNFDDDVHKEMLNMQKEYVVLSEEFDGLEGAIGEELRGEYATTLDWLKQNMYMLADLGKEYMEFTSKRIKLDDVKSSDEATQSNMKDMPNTEEENNEENGQLETDEKLQEETNTEELDKEEPEEKEKLNTPEEDLNALEEEKKRQRKGEYKKNSIEARRDIRAAAKDILTPTMTRIYNINKRIAGRLTQMETQTGINIYRYTQKSQGFVDTYNKLSKAQQLEVSMALFDFGALAKEQTEETIQEYKENERKKLRDVLSKNGFKDDDINSMFEVLNDLGTRYKESGMEITLSDMYFPRTVTDYEGLINYLNNNSEKPTTSINTKTLYREIQRIINDKTMTDEQKNAEIANKLAQNFTPRVSTKTKYAKEKKLGLLSDWGAGIYAYYADPVDSLASYITSMEQSIQKRLFLWGMKETEGIEIDIEGQTNDESVSEIVRTMFEKGQITESQMNELHTSLMAILNKKGTPRRVRTIKNITYTMALTNYISAMNQAEDLGVAIVENKKGLKSVVKSIFTKAGIQYDDAGLESAYEMFKTNSGLSDTLFKKSGFNAIDRVGKRSFLNAAWRSMVETYKEPKARGHMYERLVAMYGDKKANRIMECVRTNNYMVGKKGDQQIDIDVLTDLLYQLGNTQPIYQSAMPVAYLQHPEVRWLYSLSMFSLRQIDHIIQSTKSAYERGGFKNAAAVALWLVATRMFFNALIGDIGDLLKGDLDESWMWKLFEGDWEGAGEKFGADFLKGFGKIWMFSDYDRKKRKNEGFWAFAANRVYPYIFQEMYRGRKSVQNALKNDDRTELMTMLKDVPLLGKQAYGRWDYFRGDTEKSKKKVGGKIKKESSGKKKVGGKL